METTLRPWRMPGFASRSSPCWFLASILFNVREIITRELFGLFVVVFLTTIEDRFRFGGCSNRRKAVRDDARRTLPSIRPSD